MKISVIIPTYKRPLLLKKCLDALMLQCYPKADYEIIIVTDGPDTDTMKIVEQYREKLISPALVCIALPNKKGPAAARNAGCKIAGGQLYLFTDDDCIPDPEWIKTYQQAFEKYQQKAIAFTGKIEVPVSNTPTDFERNTAHLETADFVTANCACTKIAFQQVHGFDEDFTMAWREDSDLEFKLLKQAIPIIKIKEALVVHPVRKASWGISLMEQKKSMFNALLFKKHPQLYRVKIRSAPVWNYYFIILFLLLFLLSSYFHLRAFSFLCLAIWISLIVSFIFKRLSRTSHSFSHTMEMIATSVLIPFLSVFWTLYGAFKFKVLHL